MIYVETKQNMSPIPLMYSSYALYIPTIPNHTLVIFWSRDLEYYISVETKGNRKFLFSAIQD